MKVLMRYAYVQGKRGLIHESMNLRAKIFHLIVVDLSNGVAITCDCRLALVWKMLFHIHLVESSSAVP